MGIVAAEALFTSLERGKKGGTFLIIGDDEYFKEETVQTLIEWHLDPATRDFNLDQLRGQSLDPETLASICQTPPMLAEWRVVVVRDAQSLAANARIRSAVDGLTAQQIPGLALILVTSTGDKLKAKFFERLKKVARTVVRDALSPGDVPGWLIDRAAAAGVKLESAAARALAATSGPGVGVLSQELDKLIEFVGERRQVRVADVAQLVGTLPRINRWDWFDMVGDARFAEARTGLPVLLEGSESGVGLLIGLGTQILRIGVALSGGERALQSTLPRHQQFLAKRTHRQSRNWTRPRVDAALEDLLRADRLMKSASLAPHHVLDELLLRMQHGKVAA